MVEREKAEKLVPYSAIKWPHIYYMEWRNSHILTKVANFEEFMNSNLGDPIYHLELMYTGLILNIAAVMGYLFDFLIEGIHHKFKHPN